MPREFQGYEAKITLKHETGYSFEESFRSAITIDNLKNGNWEIYALVYNSSGVEIRKGLTHAYINNGDSLEIFIPLAPVGVGFIELEINIDSKVDYLYLAAYDTSDFNKEIILYDGVPKSTPFTIPSQEIPSGLYHIRSAVMKGGRISGGDVTLALVDNESLTLHKVEIPSDSEKSINSNVLYRFKVTSGFPGYFTDYHVANYRLFDSDYSASVDMKYHVSESSATDQFRIEKDLSCSLTIDGSGSYKRVHLKVDHPDPNLKGTYKLNYHSENQGTFLFSTDLSGDIALGTFTVIEGDLKTLMEYFLIEQKYTVLDMPNIGPYSGNFTQIIDPRDNSFSFYSEPFINVGIPSTSPTATEAVIKNPDIQTYNLKYDYLDISDISNKSYTVYFTLNGVSSYIRYQFYSEFKGLAEYKLPDGSGGSVTGVAPFTTYSYESIPFSMYDGSHKRYRRDWGYSQHINYSGINYLNTPLSVKSPGGVSTGYNWVRFVTNSANYNSMELLMSETGAYVTEGRFFHDVEYLGNISTNEYLFSGIYFDDGTRNNEYLEVGTQVFQHDEPVIMIVHFVNGVVSLQRYKSNIYDTLTNYEVQLIP